VDVSDPDTTPASRIERSLTYAVVTVIGLSILAIVAVLVSGLAKVLLDNIIWQTIALLPVVGLPIGFILMMVLLVISTRRRLRDSRGSR
jgi:hypothetical protein